MHKIKECFIKICRTIYFFFRLVVKEDIIDYIKKFGDNNMCSSKKLVMLANGPSLSGVLKNWKRNNKFKDVDFLAVNYFCHDKEFIELKPKYYVLSDPQFFQDDSLLRERVDKMYLTLNEVVSWKMFLYIQYYAKNSNWSTKIKNINIKIIPFHTVVYTGYNFLRNWIFKCGLGNGNYGTVILNGEYIGINLGYKELYLYGVDHDFFNYLMVDDKNQVCNITTHFYSNTSVLKPIFHYYISGRETKYTMYEYLQEKAYLFHGHEIMREYANYRSVKIYNCTNNSLIDAYERIKS
jgi:hypothetical protein